MYVYLFGYFGHPIIHLNYMRRIWSRLFRNIVSSSWVSLKIRELSSIDLCVLVLVCVKALKQEMGEIAVFTV